MSTIAIEDWQIKPIKTNLVKLVQDITCNEIFKLCLREQKSSQQKKMKILVSIFWHIIFKKLPLQLLLITTEQVKTGSITAATKYLLEILFTRKNGFTGLVDALKKSEQTGPLEILRQPVKRASNFTNTHMKLTIRVYL